MVKLFLLSILSIRAYSQNRSKLTEFWFWKVGIANVKSTLNVHGSTEFGALMPLVWELPALKIASYTSKNRVVKNKLC